MNYITNNEQLQLQVEADAQVILDHFRSKQKRVETFHDDNGVARTPLVDITSEEVAAHVSL